ncbi:MAG: beta-lactamase family protein [Bacteroidales bacterium]|nr:beta-lactamase family protein [Bacteroidales bacterium]
MNRISLSVLIFLLLQSCSKNEPAENVSLYFPPKGTDTWETVSPASLGWNTSEIPALLDLLENNGTRAFILLKDGKIVMEEYFGNNLAGTAPFSKSALWYWASAGKTLTSFTVGKAQEDGFLNINDKTSDYLGEGWTSLTSQKEALITVRHQLTMTTGLDDDVADNHSLLPEDLIYKADAGTRWAYHNGPYTLLESVVKNAVSMKFESYFNSVLRDKTGMDGTWIWTDNDHVYYSTARSMARFGLLMLNNGKWDGEEIMTDSDYFNEMISASQNLNKSYGYLFWLNGKESFMMPESQLVFPGSTSPDAPDDMYSGLGKNGQYVSIIPSEKLVLIRMGEDPSSVPVPFLFLNEIWKKLNPIIK